MALGKPLKILGIVIGAFVALIVIAVVTLSIMYPPQKIKALVLPQIEKAVGRSVQVQGAGISFFPVFGIKITGLEVSNTAREGFIKDPFVTLDEFVVKVKLLPLLQKKAEIKAIIINKPNILLEVDKSGSFNYEDLAFLKPSDKAPRAEKPKEEKKGKGAAPALPIPLTLEKFAINQGTVAYIDNKAGRTIRIGQINHRIDFSIDKQLKDITSAGELKLSDISVKTGEIPKALSGITFTFSHDVGVNAVDGLAEIKSMRLSLQKIYIGLSGTVKNFNVHPELNLAVKTDKIYIADLLREVPVELVPEIGKLKAEGYIELALELAGIIDSTGVPRMDGKFTLGDGIIQYTDLPESISNIRADISFTKNSLVIRSFGFNLGKNPVMLQGTVNNFAAPDVDGGLSATVNFDDLKNIVKLPEGVSLSGMVKADIKAKGIVDPKDPSKMNVDGNVALTNVRAVTPEITKPVVVNGTVGFTPKQIVNKMNIGIGSSDVNINANISDYLAMVVKDSTKTAPRPKINFAVTSALLNTDEFMAPAKQASAAPQAASAPKAAAAPAKSNPSPILAAPLPFMDINGTLACKRIIYKNISMNNFQTKISSVNDIMAIVSNAQIFSGSLSNNLNLNARNLNNVQISNKFDIINVEANDFITQFKGLLGEDQALYKELKKLDNKVFGKLTMKTDFKGNGATTDDLTRSLDGSINARVDNGRIASSVFTQSINERVNNFSEKTRIPVNNVINFGDIVFKDLKILALVKNEQVQLESFDITSAKAGDWLINGKVGFNGALDMVFEDRLTRDMSQKILSLQDKVKGVAKGALSMAEKELGKKVGGGISQALGNAAQGQLDKALIQPDKDGRVIMAIGMGGTAAAPKANSFGFKEQKSAGEKPAEETKTPKQELTQKVQEVKKEVQQQVEKVTEQATQKVDEVIEKTVPKEAKKDVEDVKKAGVKKLKKLF